MLKVLHYWVQKGIILTVWLKWKVSFCGHITHETRISDYLSNEMLCQPSVSKFINLKPDHHMRITG